MWCLGAVSGYTQTPSCRAMGLVAGSNDDGFFMRGSGPLALAVRSVDTASCHGVHKCGMAEKAIAPGVCRVYRRLTAAN